MTSPSVHAVLERLLYLPVLQVIEPHLRGGALVVADNVNLSPTVLKPFLDYVGSQDNGYLSVELPIGDWLAVSLRLGSR